MKKRFEKNIAKHIVLASNRTRKHKWNVAALVKG